MARPRKYDEQFRDHLVEVASELLAESGPSALTVRAVAARAGATTSAIYGLLGAKAELVRAVYREGFDRFGRALAAAPRTDDPVADLRSLGHAYRGFALDNPHFYAVMFGRPVPEFEPDAEDAAAMDATFEQLVEALRRCRDAGVIEAADPRWVAMQFWAGVHGLASLELRGLPDGLAPERLWDDALGRLIRGSRP